MDRPHTASGTSDVMAVMQRADAHRQRVCAGSLTRGHERSWQEPADVARANDQVVSACWDALCASADPMDVWAVLQTACPWNANASAPQPPHLLHHSLRPLRQPQRMSDAIRQYVNPDGPPTSVQSDEESELVTQAGAVLRHVVAICRDNPQHPLVDAVVADGSHAQSADQICAGGILKIGALVGSALGGRDNHGWTISGAPGRRDALIAAHPDLLVAWRHAPVDTGYTTGLLVRPQAHRIPSLEGPDGPQIRQRCMDALRTTVKQVDAACTQGQGRPHPVSRSLARSILEYHASGLSIDDLDVCIQVAHGRIDSDNQVSGHGTLSPETTAKLTALVGGPAMAKILPILSPKGTADWAKATADALAMSGDASVSAAVLLDRSSMADPTTCLRIAKRLDKQLAAQRSTTTVPRLSSIAPMDTTAAPVDQLLKLITSPASITAFVRDEPFMTIGCINVNKTEAVLMGDNRITALARGMQRFMSQHPDAVRSGLADRTKPLGVAAFLGIGSGCQDDDVWRHLVRVGIAAHGQQEDSELEHLTDRMWTMPPDAVRSMLHMPLVNRMFTEAAGRVYAGSVSAHEREVDILHALSAPRDMAPVRCMLDDSAFMMSATMGCRNRCAIMDLAGHKPSTWVPDPLPQYRTLMTDYPDLAPQIMGILLKRTVAGGDGAERAGKALAICGGTG